MTGKVPGINTVHLSALTNTDVLGIVRPGNATDYHILIDDLVKLINLGAYGSYKMDESVNTTIDISGVALLEVYCPEWEFGGGRTVTDLTNPKDGQVVKVHAQGDDLTTIAHCASIRLNNGAAWAPSGNGYERELDLYYSNYHQVWWEIARAAYPPI